MKDMIYLLAIAFIWGGTNPFLKKGGRRMVEGKQYDHVFIQFISDQYHLYSDIRYLIPFIINICGSGLYYYMLSQSDLSIFIPFTNALTLSCTMIMSVIVKETQFRKNHLLGIGLIAMGGYILSLAE